MKKLLLVPMFLISGLAFSQSKFVEATIVNRNGQSEKILVKTQNQNNAVTSFVTKKNDNDKEVVLLPKDFESISYNSGTKYVSVVTNFSRFDDIKIEENNSILPTEKALLLRVVLEGPYNLFQYNDSNSRAFFYQDKNGEIKQLINKRYYRDTNVVTDNSYKKELANLFGISEDSKDIRFLEYYEDPLKKLFLKYSGSDASNKQVKVYSEKEKTGNFSMGIVAGVVNSSLSMNYQGDIAAEKASYKFSNTGFLIGVNFEYKLNFFNASVFIQPSFQSFTDEVDSAISPSKKVKLDYNNILLPFGVKYNFYDQRKSTVSAKAMGILYLPMDAKTENLMDYSYVGQDNSIDAKLGFGIGLSYEYNKKLSAEIRYSLPRKLVQSKNGYVYSSLWDTEYNSISFILGYQLF